MRHFVAASCPRTPDSQNYMLVTYVDDPVPWESAWISAEGRGLANNVRNFWQFATDNDLVVAPHFVDPQVGRSDPDAHASPTFALCKKFKRRPTQPISPG
jgi:hypothetical protein